MLRSRCTRSRKRNLRPAYANFYKKEVELLRAHDKVIKISVKVLENIGLRWKVLSDEAKAQYLPTEEVEGSSFQAANVDLDGKVAAENVVIKDEIQNRSEC
ncbi:hypothetical protein O6P43_013938 [Quillaja saponaria]|uniref:HMG box domain-containing protein n=1 Tax=Quillaja saponaria TaxID=32244 RepID=A0AAD7LTP5_QUISA|nr:hypothetical protein O6P43_013938 [Quillaja saponaria]